MDQIRSDRRREDMSLFYFSPFCILNSNSLQTTKGDMTSALTSITEEPQMHLSESLFSRESQAGIKNFFLKYFHLSLPPQAFFPLPDSPFL